MGSQSTPMQAGGQCSSLLETWLESGHFDARADSLATSDGNAMQTIIQYAVSPAQLCFGSGAKRVSCAADLGVAVTTMRSLLFCSTSQAALHHERTCCAASTSRGTGFVPYSPSHSSLGKQGRASINRSSTLTEPPQLSPDARGSAPDTDEVSICHL